MKVAQYETMRLRDGPPGEMEAKMIGAKRQRKPAFIVALASYFGHYNEKPPEDLVGAKILRFGTLGETARIAISYAYWLTMAPNCFQLA